MEYEIIKPSDEDITMTLEAAKEFSQRNDRRVTIINQLKEYDYDFNQDRAGLVVPNLGERLVRYRELHDELRQLDGKAHRVRKN